MPLRLSRSPVRDNKNAYVTTCETTAEHRSGRPAASAGLQFFTDLGPIVVTALLLGNWVSLYAVTYAAFYRSHTGPLYCQSVQDSADTDLYHLIVRVFIPTYHHG